MVKEATLPTDTKIGKVTGKELSYLEGLSGNIQKQLKGVTEGNKGVDLTGVKPGTAIPSAKLKQLTSSVDKITISTSAGNSVLTLSNVVGGEREYINAALGIKANISSSGRLTISQFPVLVSREKVEKGT